MQSKQQILKECQGLFKNIRQFTNDLKVVFEDKDELDVKLRLIHGQFSKLELNMYKLETIEKENSNEL